MSQKFSSWLRSKSGMAVIAGVVVLALVVAVAGSQLGWWGGPGAAGVPPDAATCGTLPTNYTVKSPISASSNGIIYTWVSGQTVESGSADYFSFVIPTAAAQSLTKVKILANAKPYSGNVYLDACNFAGADACNTPLADTSGRFKFQFVGATDNGDGNSTLKFWVQVITTRPLSYITLELPSGVVVSSPVGTYTGATCP